METFFALLSLCAGNPPATDGFPPKGPVIRSFDVLFDVDLYKLVKQTVEWLLICSYWRSFDVIVMNLSRKTRL